MGCFSATSKLIRGTLVETIVSFLTTNATDHAGYKSTYMFLYRIKSISIGSVRVQIYKV